MPDTSTPQPQPQPQPQPTPLSAPGRMAVSTVTEDEEEGRIHANRHYITPMPRSATDYKTNSSSVVSSIGNNAGIMIAHTPVEDAIKLEGPEFEQIMKERTRRRRNKEDSHVAELRVKVSRLEQALAAETKRRVEAMRALEKQANNEVQHWEEHYLKELQEQRELMEDRIKKLEERFDQLEDRWRRESEQQKHQINGKGEEFQAALNELRTEADTERKLRSVREGQFLQQIEAHGKHYEELWNKERQERIESLGELVNQLDSNEETRKDSRKAVEVRLEQELAQLQKELESETAERKRRDEEISNALDKYTYQFQQSLKIISDEDYA